MKSRMHVIEVATFGQLPDGREAHIYTLSNQNGMSVDVSDYGATLVSVFTPDRDGEIQDLLHGYDSVDGYVGSTNPYFGNSVGRFGNRIADGKFSLDGKDYTLTTNNDPGGVSCHLHGGVDGFNRRLWLATPKRAPRPQQPTPAPRPPVHSSHPRHRPAGAIHAPGPHNHSLH